MQQKPFVYIVDPDPGFRDALSRRCRDVSLCPIGFAEPSPFLCEVQPDHSGCIVLDLCLPQMGGLRLQELLAAQHIMLPAIVLTSNADLDTAVQAMKNGAFEFLRKPCSFDVVIDRIWRALELDKRNKAKYRLRRCFGQRYAALSERERQVLRLLMEGKVNKEIAACLELSPKTVENYRANLMIKMQAKTFAHLIRSVCEGMDGDWSSLGCAG